MSWKEVGGWIKDNAGTGAALVGSIMTGNVPAAVAAGISLVSSATGSDDPVVALERLQSDPATVVRLKELAVQEEASIREHIREMKQLDIEAEQKAHETTQATIRSGDNAEDIVVRRTRPLQSWCSLFAAFAYVFFADEVDIMILGALLTLPWAYAGLRQVGKGIDAFVTKKANS